MSKSDKQNVDELLGLSQVDLRQACKVFGVKNFAVKSKLQMAREIAEARRTMYGPKTVTGTKVRSQTKGKLPAAMKGQPKSAAMKKAAKDSSRAQKFRPASLKCRPLTSAERREMAARLGAGWLDRFDEFLVGAEHEVWYGRRCSAANTASVLNTLRKLVGGKGIKHPRSTKAPVFLQGQKLRLDSDVPKLQLAAKLWEARYGEDKSHGWLIRHPLKKLLTFQRHLISGGRPSAFRLQDGADASKQPSAKRKSTASAEQTATSPSCTSARLSQRPGPTGEQEQRRRAEPAKEKGGASVQDSADVTKQPSAKRKSTASVQASQTATRPSSTSAQPSRDAPRRKQRRRADPAPVTPETPPRGARLAVEASPSEAKGANSSGAAVQLPCGATAEAQAAAKSSTNELPEIEASHGERRVVPRDGRLCFRDNGSWMLLADECAVVVETDEHGDFKLRNSRGVVTKEFQVHDLWQDVEVRPAQRAVCQAAAAPATPPRRAASGGSSPRSSLKRKKSSQDAAPSPPDAPELLAWLQRHRLQEYYDAMLRTGYDDLTEVREQLPEEREEMFLHVEVKAGHKRRFHNALAARDDASVAQSVNRECPVCFSGPSGEEVACVPCGHVFCREHAEKALAAKSCFVCRGAVSTTQAIFA